MDLLNTLSKFINIINIGNRNWALCPFHKEKKESFLINNEKGYFFCFGCRKSGDKKYFLRKLLGFKNCFSDSKKKNNLYNYSKIRKINFSILNNFGLFFYENKKYNNLKEISGRLIIPLNNYLGKKIGYAIRNVNNNYNCKYFFSSLDISFSKNNYIYGLFECIKYIKKEKSIIIVEGFFDLYRIYSLNFKSVVSILGNNISSYNINYLLKFNVPLFIFFDSDCIKNSSYYNFVVNNFYIFKNKIGYLKLVFIDKGDPDTFLIKKNKKDLLILLNNSKNIEDYIIENKKLYKKFNFFILKNIYKYKKIIKKKNFNKIKNDFIKKKKKIFNYLIKKEKKSSYFMFEKEFFSCIKKGLIGKKNYLILKKNFLFFKIKKKYFKISNCYSDNKKTISFFIIKNLEFKMNFYIKNNGFFKKYKKKVFSIFNKLKNEKIRNFN